MHRNKAHMHRLFMEKIAGTISEEDDRLLEQMIRRHEKVRRDWEALRQRMTSGRGRAFLDQLNETEAWQRVSEQLKPAARREARTPLREPPAAAGPAHRGLRTAERTRIRIRNIAAAAVLLLLAGTAAFWLMRPAPPAGDKAPPSVQLELGGKRITLSDSAGKMARIGQIQFRTQEKVSGYTPPRNAEVQWGTLVVPPAKDYYILLPDSSEVWLNAASRLRFPLAFAGESREVYLQEGEAYFVVKKNAEKPFVVHTSRTNIRVTGTSFNVNTYEENAIVTSLVEGSVLTGAEGHKEVSLERGQQAVFRDKTGFITGAFDESTVLSWMEGVYYFHNTPLNDIAKVLTRWFNLRVLIEDPRLAKKTFTGDINKHQPIHVFLSNLYTAAGINSELGQGVLYLR